MALFAHDSGYTPDSNIRLNRTVKYGVMKLYESMKKSTTKFSRSELLFRFEFEIVLFTSSSEKGLSSWSINNGDSFVKQGLLLCYRVYRNVLRL